MLTSTLYRGWGGGAFVKARRGAPSERLLTLEQPTPAIRRWLAYLGAMSRRRRGRKPGFDLSDPLLHAEPVATLDLHGFTAAEAELAVRNFVQTWQRRAPGKVVHIVTGKGGGSAGAPVLRSKVGRLLKEGLGSVVRSFEKDSNEGGYVVELR